MGTLHAGSLAATASELRDALANLTYAERYFEEARLVLEAAQIRHRTASLAVVNRCIEINKISAEFTAARQSNANAVHTQPGNPQ